MTIKHNGSRIKTYRAVLKQTTVRCSKSSLPQMKMLLKLAKGSISLLWKMHSVENTNNWYLFSLGLFSLFNRSSFLILQSPGILPRRQEQMDWFARMQSKWKFEPTIFTDNHRSKQKLGWVSCLYHSKTRFECADTENCGWTSHRLPTLWPKIWTLCLNKIFYRSLKIMLWALGLSSWIE